MRWKRFWLAVILLGLINYLRPLPKPTVVYDIPSPPTSKAVAINWPEAKQAAIGAVGYSVFDAVPTGEAVPIASVAKVMTALAVLKQKPIAGGQTGPKLAMDASDVGLY